jgi:hypothetical protein
MRERYSTETYGGDGRGDRATNLRWAGYFLIAVGVIHVVQGLVALLRDEYLTKRTDYLDLFHVHGWGWAHLVVGVLAIATGAALLRKMVWARPVAIALAAISITVGFFYLPFQLVVSVLIMVADCLVIAAVVAPGVFERDD